MDGQWLIGCHRCYSAHGVVVKDFGDKLIVVETAHLCNGSTCIALCFDVFLAPKQAPTVTIANACAKSEATIVSTRCAFLTALIAILFAMRFHVLEFSDHQRIAFIK